MSALGQPCTCGTRPELHRPVLHLPVPLSVKALVAVTNALSTALKENGEEAFFLTDEHHETNVIYAMPSTGGAA